MITLLFHCLSTATLICKLVVLLNIIIDIIIDPVFAAATVVAGDCCNQEY